MGRQALKKLPGQNITAEFFRRAQQGDPEGTSELIKRIEGRLFRFCMYLTGNPQMAEDLCQDAYVKVLENIHSLSHPERFVGWLFLVTKNCFLDYIRSPKNKPAVNIADIELKERSREIAKDELYVQICQALKPLKTEERYILLLIYLEGRSYAEVAEIFGVTEESIRSKLRRLRGAFEKNFLSREYKP